MIYLPLLLFSQTGVPTFLSSMRSACLGYEEYISTKGQVLNEK